MGCGPSTLKERSFVLVCFAIQNQFYPSLSEADETWLVSHTNHDRTTNLEMFHGYCGEFPGGMRIDQYTALFPDLKVGLATSKLVFRS